MRKLFVLILLLASLSCFAQNEWAPVGAKWWYEEQDLPIWGPPPYAVWSVTTEVVGEVIINGKSCKEITTRYCTICGDVSPCFIYSDSNRVYYYNTARDTFFLLYDMNLLPNESWIIYYNSPWAGYEDSLIVNVVDTFSTEINGVFLKSQQIEVVSGYLDIGNEIIELIGSTFSFFPIDYGACKVGFGLLRCYVDSTNQIYLSNGNCEYTDVGIFENEVSNIKFFPNPINNIAIIEFENKNSVAFTVRIIDITGRVVIEKGNIRTSRIELNSQTLPPGIYQYQLVSEKEHKQSMGKFLVR